MEHQKKTGLHLGEAILELRLLPEEVLRQALCTQLNVPFIDLDNITLDRSLSKLINKKYAQKNNILPISRIGDTVTMAMDDPTNTSLVQELSSFTGLRINVCTSTTSALKTALSRLYDEDPAEPEADSQVELLEELPDQLNKKSKYLELQAIGKADTLVNKIITAGLSSNATDIHIETMDRQVFVRFRIDGVLQEAHLGQTQDDVNRHGRQIVSRIKVLGKLDIAEKRRPQDGSFRAKILKEGEHANIDFRVSIVPGYYGENVVLRILNNRNAPTSIDQLGFSQKITQTLHRLLRGTTEIVLITGPTGSGKSSTLYGGLMTIYRPGIKILTAEDPIEYVYDKINQCEVNPRIGNTFAGYVRAFLRQDPEVIMIGEIRDPETAEMAFGPRRQGTWF